MTAREAISAIRREQEAGARVDADTPLLEVLSRLLETPDRRLAVEESGEKIGEIDSDSLLEALGRMLPARDDSSVIELECVPADYSASVIARAIEDTDVHLVDLLTSPSEGGRMHVTLRVRCEDPTAAVHSLERYGYEVTGQTGRPSAAMTASIERLLAVQTLINV